MNFKSKISNPDSLLAALVALVALVVFANSLGGDFVYDDRRQILRNPLIQDAALYATALSSDVWAFKSDAESAASNYYRPTFVAWLILNFRIFGTDPFGWHFAGVLLHALVCALAYLLLRRLRFSQAVSLAVTSIFAVHPVHAESVAWISGAPDLLFAAALLGSLLAAESWTRKPSLLKFIVVLALYAVALGAKEVALFCFPIYFLIFAPGGGPSAETAGDGGETALSVRSFHRSPAVLTLAVAAGYFLLRWAVLGKITHPVEDAPDAAAALLTAPAVFVFYVKQMLFPAALSINYPLRPSGEADLVNFFIPLILTLSIGLAIYLFCRRSRAATLGAALFLLPLLPVLYVGAFPFEQIVHDRYLYLPLFGFLTLVFSAFSEALRAGFPVKADSILIGLAVLLAAALAGQTFFYNRVFETDLSLWRHAAGIDARSAWTQLNYGAALEIAGRHAEAVDAFDRSIDVRPHPLALTGRGRSHLARGQFEAARRDLLAVTALAPKKVNAYTLYQSYEALVLVYAQSGELERAVESLREARGRLPIYRAAITEKLAVVLYQQGDRTGALAELESVREAAAVELLPESKTVLLRIGMLYAELGKPIDARAALQQYLDLTAEMSDPLTRADRPQALALLNRLKR